VIGTSSTHLDFLHSLGVDEVIDYATTPFENVVRDVDVVLASPLMAYATAVEAWAKATVETINNRHDA